jgi:hypothetical protein
MAALIEDSSALLLLLMFCSNLCEVRSFFSLDESRRFEGVAVEGAVFSTNVVNSGKSLKDGDLTGCKMGVVPELHESENRIDSKSSASCSRINLAPSSILLHNATTVLQQLELSPFLISMDCLLTPLLTQRCSIMCELDGFLGEEQATARSLVENLLLFLC